MIIAICKISARSLLKLPTKDISFKSNLILTAYGKFIQIKGILCRFENLPKSSSSYGNNMLKISHKNTFYIFRYVHVEICEKFVYKHSEIIEYVKNGSRKNTPGKSAPRKNTPRKIAPRKIAPPKKKYSVKLPHVTEYLTGENFVNFKFRQS